MLYLITIERGLHDTLMPWYTDLTPLFIFTSLVRRKNAPQRGLNLLLCAAFEMSERALDMLIWPLLSILNLHQTNFIEHSKNPHNECKTGYFAIGHDSPSGQYWYQSLQEIDDVLQRLDDSLMSLRALRLVLIDTRHIIGDQMMGWGHGMTRCHPDTRHLSLNYYPDPLCLTFSAETMMGCILTWCSSEYNRPSFVSITDLHRILGKTGTNQQSNTNDINITDKWIQ